MAQREDKTLVVSGFLWNFLERIAAQVVSFVVSTLLARFLLPEEYGTIALVNVFITLANVFVTSGFGNALIQKKDADETDFSSVFYFSFTISCLMYSILFFCAPLIASVYKQPELTLVCRVMGLRLIIASFNTVQHAYVSRHLLFRRFFWATLIGTVVSGVAGVAMAFFGFGIWALVAQYMINVAMDTVVLFFTVKWRPRFLFSFRKLWGLISYGWKLLVAELVNTGYMELRSLVIGLGFSSADLAYYNRGQSFPKLVVVNVNSSIQRTLFPVLSKHQDDLRELRNMTRQAIRTSAYVVQPLIVGLALVAEPLICVLLTDQWIECVPFLQVYCLSYAVNPMLSANLQAIKAVGRTDVYLKQEIVKKIVGIAMLLVAMPFGAFAIAVSAVTSNIFGYVLTAVANRKLLEYSFLQQIRDLFDNAIPLVSMSVAVFLIGLIPMPDLPRLAVMVMTGAVVYVVTSWIQKNKSFHYLLGFIKRFIKRKK